MELFENILALLSGIGVFIVGMNLMSSNLQKASGAGLKRLIGKITNNKILGISIGAAVTGLIHSSAATTIMVIGFVNAGVMALDDEMVKDICNYQPIRKLGNLKNVKTIVFNDRGHHPHYTKEANMQYADLNNRLRQYSKEKKSVDEMKMLLNDINWGKVVEQDQNVWNEVARFLRGEKHVN